MRIKYFIPIFLALLLVPSVSAPFVSGVGSFVGSAGLPTHRVNLTILSWDPATETFIASGLIYEPNQRLPTYVVVSGVLTSTGYMVFTDPYGHSFVYTPTYSNVVVEPDGSIWLYTYGILTVDGVPGEASLNFRLA